MGKKKDTLYTFSVIYGEAESNIGLFYQESHTKTSLDEEDTTPEDILTRIADDLEIVTLRVADGKLMAVMESGRFTYSNDLEDVGRFHLAVMPGEDEEQIPFEPNITEDGFYDENEIRNVSDFNGFVEVVETDDDFFAEIKAMAQNENFVFYPEYICFDEDEVDSSSIETFTTKTVIRLKK